jgi:hypothetical protein
MALPQWLMRVNEKLWNEGPSRAVAKAANPSEVTMWIQALMLTPYVAIAASLALGVTVAAVCCTQPAPRGVGFA